MHEPEKTQWLSKGRSTATSTGGVVAIDGRRGDGGCEGGRRSRKPKRRGRRCYFGGGRNEMTQTR